ncbi:MAG: radical SAM protein [Methanolinea sp.]|jgi:radical SAM superfamily enzyme with C-terminal helix-hairpin-helix motif|nr:radical SAM protein [Methanolinea sp.]
MKQKSACILDGYVDEPACLGVPPYISPYIRTVAGALIGNGYSLQYLTIDQVRKDPGLFAAMNTADLVVMIAGVTVPGKYLGGTPATLTEIRQVGAQLRSPKTFLAGPIGFGYSSGGGQKAVKEAISGFEYLLTGSPATALDTFLREGKTHGTFDYRRENPWAVSGAVVIRDHPCFPWVMCEMETARGCSRAHSGGCSFCTEPFYGPPVFRMLEGITAEIEALQRAGARHFRIGRQPDIMVYGASPAEEYPTPVPGRVEELFSAVRGAAPDLLTLHIDNVNPGTIARHPEESRAALDAIIAHHTPGDVAAFGMETADPVVIAKNNLKAGPAQVMEAIRIVNQAGMKREAGIPHLLPGLNFISGLAGETMLTFDLNMEFLAHVLASGCLVRRVNIRQLMPFEGTRAFSENALGLHQTQFRHFKEQVRKRFDLPMLTRVFPVGTVLSRVVVEEEGSTSFGRQMGSYPILVGIPLRIPARTVLDVVVVDHGMRSLTAFPVPIDINALPPGTLAWLPGVGKKRAGRIAARRPFSNLGEFQALVGATPLDAWLTFVRSPSAR